MYWLDAVFHPFHVLDSDGKRTIDGDPPWTVGKSIIRPLKPFGSEDLNLTSEASTWSKFQARDGGDSDRDKAEVELRDLLKRLTEKAA